jgi:hypothetical protein
LRPTSSTIIDNINSGAPWIQPVVATQLSHWLCIELTTAPFVEPETYAMMTAALDMLALWQRATGQTDRVQRKKQKEGVYFRRQHICRRTLGGPIGAIRLAP